MIGPNSRFAVLSRSEDAVVARGAFVAQLDATHFLIDVHEQGLYSQRVVDAAIMKDMRMRVFPSDDAYNRYVSAKVPLSAPPRAPEIVLSDDEIAPDADDVLGARVDEVSEISDE